MQLVKESKEFTSLDVEDLMEILSDDELNVKNEETVFDAVVKWVDEDPMTRKIHLLDLLKCIRLGTLSTDFVKIIQKWDLVQESQVSLFFPKSCPLYFSVLCLNLNFYSQQFYTSLSCVIMFRHFFNYLLNSVNVFKQ